VQLFFEMVFTTAAFVKSQPPANRRCGAESVAPAEEVCTSRPSATMRASMAALIALLGGLASAAPEQVGLIHRFLRRLYVFMRSLHLTGRLPIHPQVHISLTGRANEMGVDFVTSAGSSGLSARFGTSALSLLSVAPAVSTNLQATAGRR
jgi:hypothetical protein